MSLIIISLEQEITALTKRIRGEIYIYKVRVYVSYRYSTYVSDKSTQPKS